MDWLTRLPWVGPAIARLMRTHAWRTWMHYSSVKGDRLAGAATYAGFLALFPLIAVGAAIAAATLTTGQIHRVEDKVSQQVPFLSDQIDLEGLVRNAGTVGVVGGVLLVASGLGWVDTLRGCLRAVWREPEPEESVVKRKGKDLLILGGLGGVVVVSLLASTLTTTLVGRVASWIGIAEHGAGAVLLRVAGEVVAVGANFVSMVYLMRWLPGVRPERRELVQASLMGAVGFEVLKLLLSGYLNGVASRSMYGAFGTPVALLLWINFMMRLLLLCAAWAAVAAAPEPEPAASPSASRSSGDLD